MKLAFATFFFTVTAACAADVPITQDELVRRTQELYDAIVPGNRVPWKNLRRRLHLCRREGAHFRQIKIDRRYQPAADRLFGND